MGRNKKVVVWRTWTLRGGAFSVVLGCAAVLAGGCGGAAAEGSAAADPTDVAGSDAPAAQSGLDAKDAQAIHARLAEPSQREAALESLIAEFDRAAANGTDRPEVRAFVDLHVEALVQAYLDGVSELPEKKSEALINLLVSFNDERTIPAHAQAIQRYADSGKGVDAAIWACQAAQRLRGVGLPEALWSSYEQIDVSDMDGLRYSKHLARAMSFNRRPAWASDLVDKLRPEMKRPARFDDPAAKVFKNQVFWQQTAAQLLGELEADGAARVLFDVVADGSKRAVHAAAWEALALLGEQSLELAHGLLAKQASSSSEAQGLHRTAELLGILRHPSSLKPTLKAFSRAQGPVVKAELALLLSKLPNNGAGVDAFRRAYAACRLPTNLPGGEGALESMARSAPGFFEPQLAEWLAQQAVATRGSGPRKGDLQRQLIMSAAQVMAGEQQKPIRAAAKKYGGRVGTPAYEAGAELVDRCKRKASCYLKTAKTPANQSNEQDSLALKGLVMVGVYGAQAERDQLLAGLSSFQHPVLLERAVDVLLRLTPNASKETLELLSAQEKALGDPNRAAILRRARYALKLR